VIVAVASGKGGTGKTTVAVALAQSTGAFLLDADVEEPNAHLFLKPRIYEEETVYRMVPEILEEKCTFCGKCKEICRFQAVVVFPGAVLTFPEMCHACYGCLEVCPEEAIREGRRVLGKIFLGEGNGTKMAFGRLEIGEAMASPLIKTLKARFGRQRRVIIDCPPGTGCPVLTALRGADFCLLVTEPTPFGLHDLRQAVAAVKTLGIPCGVILNRAGPSFSPLYQFLKEEGLPLLLEIPHQREIAEAYAQGRGLLSVNPALRETFRQLFDSLKEMS